MESNMVNNERLDPECCVIFVKKYFTNNFPMYKLNNGGTHTGYWWVEYYNEKNNLKIYFDGDIGGHFYIKIYIKEDEYFLWQYDRKVNEMTKSTKQNLSAQLKILNTFLANIG